jgi:ribonuclease D
MESMEKPLPGQEKNLSSISAPSYHVVRTVAQLEQFVERISREKILAVDLEADSMFHYQEKVCLLQMAGNGENVVIDPLEVNDLSPLAPLFSDKKVCKVFHGSDYDVRSLYRDFSIEINNLFDTQLASMFMGERETSLGAVVSKRFGIQLDKRYQKKDWSQRPLPDGMIEYAASDVFHLIPLARISSWMNWLQKKGWSGSKRSANTCPMSGRWKTAATRCSFGSAVPAACRAATWRRWRAAAVSPGPGHQKGPPPVQGLFQHRVAENRHRNGRYPPGHGSARCLSAKQIRIYGKSLARVVQKANALATKDLPVYPRRRRPSVSPRVPERVKSHQGLAG